MEAGSMTVAAILRAKGTHVETVRPDATLRVVAWHLKVKGIGALVVTGDDERILGIISERDVVRALTEHGSDVVRVPVSEVMTSAVKTCSPRDSITAVMARMTRDHIRHLPVVEDGRLAGIVSIGDVVKDRLDELELEANILRDTLIASH
jgi:CBS domain-containing protein